PLVGHSAPSGVCSNALVLARKLYASPKRRALIATQVLSPAKPVAERRPGLVAPLLQTLGSGRQKAPAAALRCGAHLVGERQRRIGVVEEFNGHKDHFFVAKVFKVMDLELARSVGLVTGLPWPVGIFDGGAVVDMLTAAPAGHRC